jgi:hypothetical protein
VESYLTRRDCDREISHPTLGVKLTDYPEIRRFQYVLAGNFRLR